MSNDKESFDSWFNDDDHDLYNFPEEAMKEAWDAGRAEQARRIQELEAMLKKKLDLIKCGVAANYSGDPLENELYLEAKRLAGK